MLYLDGWIPDPCGSNQNMVSKATGYKSNTLNIVILLLNNRTLCTVNFRMVIQNSKCRYIMANGNTYRGNRNTVGYYQDYNQDYTVDDAML